MLHPIRTAALTAIVLAAGATAAGATTPGSPKLLSCAGRPLVKPTATVVLSCADGNSEIKQTDWSTWSAGGATGTTDFGVNPCTPTCVASRMRFFPRSTVRLADAKRTASGLLFTRAVITYTFHGTRRTFVAYPPTR
ncbi:MAG: hypothetical protein ACRDLP_11695 [Solirubrobacteraceae bacterium]